MPLYKGQNVDSFIKANQALFSEHGTVKPGARIAYFSIDDFEYIKNYNFSQMDEFDEEMTPAERDAALSKGETVIAMVEGTGFIPFSKDRDGNIPEFAGKTK